MSNEIVTQENQQQSEILNRLILDNDVSKMSQDQKVNYIRQLSHSLGMNALAQPFQLIKFQGKEIVYATKSCTEQLRKINGVSIKNIDKTFNNEAGLYLVTVIVEDKEGRQDASTGALSIRGLQGDALANAIMKAETKAKRRATLSISGLGIMDESETDTIGNYQKIDITTGAVIETVEHVQEKPRQSSIPYMGNSNNGDKKFTMPFGKTKGKHFSELSRKDLDSAKAWATKTDANKFSKLIALIDEFISINDSPRATQELTMDQKEFGVNADMRSNSDTDEDIPF